MTHRDDKKIFSIEARRPRQSESRIAILFVALALSIGVCACLVSNGFAVDKEAHGAARSSSPMVMASADSREVRQSAPAVPNQDRLKLGVSLHFGPKNKGEDHVIADFKDLGIETFRIDINWTWVERQKGKREFGPELGAIDAFVTKAAAQGIEPLLILDYGHPAYDERGFTISAEAQNGFAAFATYVAQHFKGRVKLYEVWNEWNGGSGGTPRVKGAPQPYAQLLEKVYPALKAVDPQITVLGGAIGGLDEGFSKRLFQYGSLAKMDAFSIHPYVYPGLPEVSIGWLEKIEGDASRAAGGREIPIYVTEIGWPTHQGIKGIDASLAADYLARTYLLASTRRFIKGVYWYDLYDDGRDPRNEGHNFGLFRNDHSGKPALCALKDIFKLLATSNPISAERQSMASAAAVPGGIWMAKFSSGAQFTYALWTQEPGAKATVTMDSSGSGGVPINARGICREADVTGNGTTSVGAVITGSPTIFSTSAENVTLR